MKFVFVKDWGAFLGAEKGMFYCKVKGREIWRISPAEVRSIILLSDAIISTNAIKLANEFGVEMIFFERGQPVAKVINAKYGGSMRVWLNQLKTWKKRRSEIAREFVRGKLHNQIVVLNYYRRKYDKDLVKEIGELDRLRGEVLGLNDVKDIMGREAEGAKWYWEGVRKILPSSLHFKARLKRGAKDTFNIALNIGYGMLRSRVWGAVISAGLNPYVGFLHSLRSGRVSLVFDLMEEFRSPFVDKPLISKAREDAEKVKDVKEIYSLLSSSILEEEIYSQARKLAEAMVDGEYRPYLSR
ncbi:CRISPR-associated endonuclease Cas1 [Acidianus sp. RZ1]|uniref:CRISPR-associated endonuclease Cas1 n=1 Tax=Acidianus sp. RZ1 TaxID=1540082 RepID=UPI003530174E